MRFVIARPGRFLKKLHRPNLLGFDYMGFKGKTGLKFLPGPNPVCPQRGPYEASEGIYPVMGNEKTGGGRGDSFDRWQFKSGMSRRRLSVFGSSQTSVVFQK